MPTIAIYEPALCCTSGVCGQDVDQELVDFNAARMALKAEGIRVARYNLASAPTAFTRSETVREFLMNHSVEGLPVTTVDDVIVLQGVYPTLEQLRSFLVAPSQELS